MKRSLKIFLNGILDYAGLFPPAALPLETALANYASYRGQTMLGAFILNVGRLGPLPEGRWPLVLLGTAVTHAASALRHAEADAEAVAGELGDRLGRDVTLESVELAVTCNELGRLARQQVEVYRQLSEHVQVFYETKDFAELNGSGAGLKIRTGGPSAEKFPTTGQLARMLCDWGALEVPLKLTAGLHQPLPHYDPQLEVRHHGFLNVFTAAMLARRDHLEASVLQDILGWDRPESFQFGDQGLQTPAGSLTNEEIAALRKVVTGFGSCSFEEPMDGLERHGFLEE